MATFDDLIDEAETASIEGWDFSWFDGRATEARPSWHYFDLVADLVRDAPDLLEVQAGTGSMIGRLPSLPPMAVATEGFPPSIERAKPLLRSRGVHLVVTSQTIAGLPFRDRAFALVVSRHPIEVWWTEIARVLRPGGTYFAQHVGPHTLRDLAELFMGPRPSHSFRDPSMERRAAESAGLEVTELRVERPPVEFYDVGAVVYFLRLVPWIVPGFTVAAYRQQLRQLHERIEREGMFTTITSRTLFRAIKPEVAA